MSRGLRVAGGLLIGLMMTTQAAEAQWNYPRGYGGYGFGGWGADPAAGYMAGLGAYARGKGVYDVENAKAQAINFETMQKWNTALRARQAALRQQQARDDARAEAGREARVARRSLEDGTTLNGLLSRIYDLDPAALKSARARSPLPAGAIREIPFEWDTEALTICLDQMAAEGSLPEPLMRPAYAADRDALRRAVRAALAEGRQGGRLRADGEAGRRRDRGLPGPVPQHQPRLRPGRLGRGRLLHDPGQPDEDAQ